MNNHVGWGRNGRCVWCYSDNSSTSCRDLTSEELRQIIDQLEQQVQTLDEESYFWQNKYHQDIVVANSFSRQQGAQEMKSQIKERLSQLTHDSDLIIQIESIEYQEQK
jgi:hypothetical protein